MANPTVSLIIPAYNCASLLGQAVASVRRQQWDDLRLLTRSAAAASHPEGACTAGLRRRVV